MFLPSLSLDRGWQKVENETGRIFDVSLPLHFEASDVSDKMYVQRVRTGVALLNRNVESILRALDLPIYDDQPHSAALGAGKNGAYKSEKDKLASYQRPAVQLLWNLRSITLPAFQGREEEIGFATRKRERTKKT